MIPVRELLLALGKDAEEVARYLADHGYHGERGIGELCPLAVYLRANGIVGPAVDLSTVTYMLGPVEIVEDLPPAAEDFVSFFDDGDFPQLQAP